MDGLQALFQSQTDAHSTAKRAITRQPESLHPSAFRKRRRKDRAGNRSCGLVVGFACFLLSATFTCFNSVAALQKNSDERIAQVEQQLRHVSGGERIPLLVELAETQEDDAKEALRLTDEILELVQDHPDTVAEARTRISRSWALQSVGDYPAAVTEAQLAESLSMVRGQESSLARACYMMAVAKWRMADYHVAIEYAERARELQVSRGDRKEIAKVLTLSGAIHRSQSEFGKALDCHFAALRLSEQQNDQAGIARSQNNIGLIYWKLDRYEDAHQSLLKALEFYQTTDSQQNMAACRGNIGLILINLDRPEDALLHLDEALEIYSRHNNKNGRAKILGNLGFAQSELGNDDRALDYYHQSLELGREIGDKFGIVRSQGSIAQILQSRQDHRTALQLFEESYGIARETGARSEQAALLEAMAVSHEAIGEYEKALDEFRRFHELQTELTGLEMQQRIAELETRTVIERREREIRDLNQIAELKNQQLDRQRTSRNRLLASSILLSFCFATVVVLFFSRVKALRLMRASNDELLSTTTRLSESEERYRMLFESSDVPTMLIEDSTRRIVDLNLPARELCGALPANGYVDVNDIGPKWIRDGILKLLSTHEGDEYACDDYWIESSGRTRWTELRGCSVLINGCKAILASARDTTDVRAQEKARMRADKLESLGLLAGGIAHDFNNALTAILGYLSIARMCDTDKSLDALEMAEAATRHAACLTLQLIAFSKGGEPVVHVHDVGQLLRSAIDLASAGSSMHVEVDTSDDLWRAELDSGQFTQVVSNLVINADQATNERGMLEVTASNFRGEPQTGVVGEGSSFVRIDFTDNGPGIPMETRDFIFDPYFTTKDDGNGLGLTTAFAIIARHGGEITFESTEGRGTRFSVFFPASDKVLKDSEIAPVGQPPGDGSILILDDEPLVQNIFKRLLEDWGYEVEAVFDGETAVHRYIERFEANRSFDVLIMDLTIPGGLGGHEATTRILNFDPHARAIVCSGYSDNPIMANFREYGFVGSLSKPFRVLDLAKAIMDVTQSGQPVDSNIKKVENSKASVRKST